VTEHERSLLKDGKRLFTPKEEKDYI